ncbi:sugar ABC transporter substrate-binding protein [Actinotalea lenta]|nr:maltose ABC transporter substrate-binding protein [Isoptericola sp. b490]
MAVAVGAGLLLAACSSGTTDTTTGGATSPATETATESATPSESATDAAPVRGNEDLVIWTDDTHLAAMQAVADTYAAANGITVGVQAVTDTRAAFITANQAGNGPDVLVGAHDWIGQLVQNGAIDPLQLPADQVAKYSPTAIKAVTYDSQLYGLPYGVESLALFCNKSVVGDTTFATLDDAIAAGQKAVDAGTVESALNLPVGENGDAYHMEPLFTSAGGYLFGKDADGNYNPNDLGLDSPGGLAAAKKIGELGEKGQNVLRTSISSDNNISLFADGKAACMISGPWALNDVRKGLGNDGYTLQPIPGFKGMNPAQPFMGAQAFYVASKGKNKSFAQDFIINGVNNVDAMTTLYEKANLPPAMTAVRDSIQQDNPDFAVIAQAAEKADPMPAIPAMAEVWQPLGVAYADIVAGKDPEQSMKDAATAIRTAIAGS